MKKIIKIFEKIGPYFSWLVLIYLVCFTFMLISEYRSNPGFADSLICEQNNSIDYTDIEDIDIYIEKETKDCDFIKEMNRKGNNLLSWALVYFLVVFFFNVVWPNRKEIMEHFEEMEEKEKKKR